MTISAVASQASGTDASSAASISKAFPGNVTAGNLIVVGVSCYKGAANDPFVVGDFSQSAGTATLGTATMDVEKIQVQGSSYVDAAIFSAPVTGTGSCTVTVAGLVGTGSWVIGVDEYTGSDIGASRVEDSDTGGNSTRSTMTTGDATSAAGALFFGVAATVCNADVAHTPDSAFTTVFEKETGATTMTGSIIRQIVTSGTTDAASWTSPGAGNSEFDWWSAVVAVYKDGTPPPPGPALNVIRSGIRLC